MKNKITVLIAILSVSLLSNVYLVISKKMDKANDISGTLRIDNSDPDITNALFLELNVPVSNIVSKKTVKFKVLNKNYIRK